MLKMGLGEFGATLAMPMMFILPRTAQPMADSTIVIVRGLQRGLNKVGYDVEVSGLLDKRTEQGLRLVSGNGWYDKTWIQLYGDLLSAREQGFRLDKPVLVANGKPEAMGFFSPGKKTYFAVGALGTAYSLLRAYGTGVRKEQLKWGGVALAWAAMTAYTTR